MFLNLRKNKRIISFFLITLTLYSCYRVDPKIEPQVSYTVQDRFVKSLPPAFPALTHEEKQEIWAQEYLIGLGFAKKLDLYRSITSFKRAEILLPEVNIKRLQEVQYYMVLSYYLGGRYSDAIYTFQESKLKGISDDFLPYHDLLVILYESYRETNDFNNAKYIYKVIKLKFPDTADKLYVSSALVDGDIKTLDEVSEKNNNYQNLKKITTFYEQNKKSVPTAEFLNAVLPGAGYLYVGQKQSALTAFLLNGLFIYASYKFFDNGYPAAGIITASFEAGWYLGGIYGGGESAKLYNERLYEKKAYPMLTQNHLFPVLMLQYGF